MFKINYKNNDNCFDNNNATNNITNNEFIDFFPYSALFSIAFLFTDKTFLELHRYFLCLEKC